jgi:hypothetical protein
MGQPRWTQRSRPRTQGHMHSEGRILCRASCHFLRRATTFPRPAHPLWPTFLSCVNFLSVFVLFIFDVLAPILIFESVQPLHASYIYVLCFPTPHPFSTAFPFCVFLFSLLMCTPMCYLFGGLLVRCYFLSSSRTICFSLTSLPAASKIGAIDL